MANPVGELVIKCVALIAVTVKLYTTTEENYGRICYLQGTEKLTDRSDFCRFSLKFL